MQQQMSWFVCRALSDTRVVEEVPSLACSSSAGYEVTAAHEQPQAALAHTPLWKCACLHVSPVTTAQLCLCGSLWLGCLQASCGACSVHCMWCRVVTAAQCSELSSMPCQYCSATCRACDWPRVLAQATAGCNLGSSLLPYMAEHCWQRPGACIACA